MTSFKSLLLLCVSACSKSILFCKEPSSYDEKWEGARIGEHCFIAIVIMLLEGFGEAVSFLGMDEAAPLSSLEGYLYDYIKSNPQV